MQIPVVHEGFLERNVRSASELVASVQQRVSIAGPRDERAAGAGLRLLRWRSGNCL